MIGIKIQQYSFEKIHVKMFTNLLLNVSSADTCANQQKETDNEITPDSMVAADGIAPMMRRRLLMAWNQIVPCLLMAWYLMVWWMLMP